MGVLWLCIFLLIYMYLSNRVEVGRYNLSLDCFSELGGMGKCKVDGCFRDYGSVFLPLVVEIVATK